MRSEYFTSLLTNKHEVQTLNKKKTRNFISSTLFSYQRPYTEAISSYTAEDYSMTVNWMEDAVDAFMFEANFCRFKCENSVDASSSKNVHHVVTGWKLTTYHWTKLFLVWVLYILFSLRCLKVRPEVFRGMWNENSNHQQPILAANHSWDVQLLAVCVLPRQDLSRGWTMIRVTSHLSSRCRWRFWRRDDVMPVVPRLWSDWWRHVAEQGVLRFEGFEERLESESGEWRTRCWKLTALLSLLILRFFYFVLLGSGWVQTDVAVGSRSAKTVRFEAKQVSCDVHVVVTSPISK